MQAINPFSLFVSGRWKSPEVGNSWSCPLLQRQNDVIDSLDSDFACVVVQTHVRLHMTWQSPLIVEVRQEQKGRQSISSTSSKALRLVVRMGVAVFFSNLAGEFAK